MNLFGAVWTIGDMLDFAESSDELADESNVSALKRERSTSDTTHAYDAPTAANKLLARSRLLARGVPPIDPYNNSDPLEISMTECYLMAVYCLPQYGAVERPLSRQYTFDNITLIQTPLDTGAKSINKRITIPVNTTRIVIGYRSAGKELADNRELIGRVGGVGDGSAAKNGSVTSQQITLGGISTQDNSFSL